jgi:Cdc6-like AAA superfamily ATPase
VYFSLEEQVKSKLNAARIFFEEYSFEELFIILAHRAKYGLIPAAYTKQLLWTVAGLADGDTKIAILSSFVTQRPSQPNSLA